MANDWFYKRKELLDQTPVAPKGEPPPKPPFKLAEFEQVRPLIREEVELLIDGGNLPDTTTAYDPRTAVIVGYFHAYADGLQGADAVLAGVRNETERLLQDNIGAAFLGNEVAKLGFLAMGRPDLASEFASAAADILRGMRLVRPFVQLEPEEPDAATGTE